MAYISARNTLNQSSEDEQTGCGPEKLNNKLKEAKLFESDPLKMSKCRFVLVGERS